MKNEQDELVARVLEKLASGRNLTAEELAHLKALDVATETTEANSSGTPDLSARTVAAVKIDRRPVYRRIAVVSLLLLMAAGLTTWWVLIGFYTGHHTRSFASRGEALAHTLPAYAFVSALVAMGAGVAAGHLLRKGLRSRSAGMILYAGSATVGVIAYRVAAIGVQRDLNLYAGALAVIMLAAIAMGFAVASDALPFKRLGRGRWLSGVFAGIARELGWKAWWLRVAFVLVVVFLKFPGLLIYLLLDASMNVHPDDRAHMWRFRIARWLRGGVATTA